MSQGDFVARFTQKDKLALSFCSSAHASADVDTSLKETLLVAFVSRPSISAGNINYTAENPLVHASDALHNDEGFHLMMPAVLCSHIRACCGQICPRGHFAVPNIGGLTWLRD